MGVRLFVGNLSYATTEAELRAFFGAVAPPSQIVVPVDRDTGRPRGFAFVEFLDRAHAEEAIRRFNGQPLNGRPLAVSEARAREDRGPGGGPGAPRPGGPGGFSSGGGGGGGGFRPGGFTGPRPSYGSGGARSFDASSPAAIARSRNFGPDAKPQRGTNAKAKKKESERPKGPIPLKATGRSFSLDDDSAADEPLVDIDDFATSRPEDKIDDDDDKA